MADIHQRRGAVPDDLDGMPALEDSIPLPESTFRDRRLKYSCKRNQLVLDDLTLEERFMELHMDEETQLFLFECHNPTKLQQFLTSCCRPFLRRFCSRLLSHTDTNGLLHTGEMFVLSRSHCHLLLQGLKREAEDVEDKSSASSLDAPPRETMRLTSNGLRLLDIGAGDGRVTVQMAPHFAEVLTTEASWMMVRRLRQKGFACLDVDDIAKLPADVVQDGFDAIALLNVIDRCDQPRTLLKQCRTLLRKPHGRLILATPLPFKPSVENKGNWRQPREYIDLGAFMTNPRRYSCCDEVHMTWEESAMHLYKYVLKPAGFEVESLSRVPYLSQGYVGCPYYVLDDALFVLTVDASA